MSGRVLSAVGAGSSRNQERRPIMYCAHKYETMTPEKRPQDDSMDGRDWTFETLEHGGEYPDLMPQAIRATDAEGRSCLYVPVSVGGKVVDSKGFLLAARDADLTLGLETGGISCATRLLASLNDEKTLLPE